MSFSMTTQQMRDGTKDVTRRLGWMDIEVGDKLWAVEKAQGLKKGQHMTKIGLIEVVSARLEHLCDITAEECKREGFPDLSPGEFIDMFMRATRCHASQIVNRIEFRRVEE
jgi:hypothetical protein